MFAIGLVAVVLLIMVRAARSTAFRQQKNAWWHVLQGVLAIVAIAALCSALQFWTQDHYGHRFDGELIGGTLILILAGVIALTIYAQRWKR